MKTNFKSAITMVVCMLTFSLGFAQGDVQNLIGANGASLENGLEQKGYTHIKTDKSGSDIYAYWWKSKNQTCICSRLSNNEVISIVKAMPFSCNKNVHGGAEHVTKYVDVQDIKGWYAPPAYEALRTRGFKELHRTNANGRTYTYWHNKETGQCVEIEEYKEDISSVNHFDSCNLYLK